MSNLQYIKEYLIIEGIIQNDIYNNFRFDEFGFRVEEEDGPEQNSKKLLGIPFVEDPQHRLINHIFFTNLI